MNQTERVKIYMQEHGKITSMESFANLGITRLSARIADLIDSGVVINKKTVYSKRKDGSACHYTEYSLAGEDNGR